MDRIQGALRSLGPGVVLWGLLGGTAAEAGFPITWSRWWGVGTGPGYHASPNDCTGITCPGGAAWHGGGASCVECGDPPRGGAAAGSEIWLPMDSSPGPAWPTPAAPLEPGSRAAPRGMPRTARVPAGRLPTLGPGLPAVRGY